MGKKKKKPLSKLETAKTVVEILVGILSIVYTIWQMVKG